MLFSRLLISQIDGILTDFAKQLGVENADRRRDKFKQDFRSKTGKDIFSVVSELDNDILLDLLFQTSYPGQPLKNPFSFNRHKIAHGEFLSYGRFDNTLRAFLILDFLKYRSGKDKK